MLFFSISCSNLDRNKIDLSVSESEDFYTIIANYNQRQARAIDEYLDAHLTKGSDMSFTNTHINADLKLDNGIKFYIKKYPGYLKIKFNKNENSVASYRLIKNLGEGLKPLLQ